MLSILGSKVADGDTDSEVALRVHIRKLLLDYSLEHLTTDHISFTEHSVSKASLFIYFCISFVNAL